jgi:predicted P-loop ATPase
LDVTRHLFPVLQGKQNSGKSTAVRKLLEPIKLFYSSRSLDMLNDSKELAVLARKNVIWFDEMSKASKADVDAIKLYTTSETVSYRILYSQNEATLRNVSTFIGCSNKSFVDIFYDPTGARRFYELKCQDKINHSKINKIDYIELWKSVDENDSNPPIEAHMKELEEAQEKIKALDSVEEFMIEEKLIPKANSEIITVPSNELYNAYTQWMKSQSRHSMFTKTKMGRRLTELGIETGKNRNTRLRYINKANLCGIVQLD